jgi:hypothetical protein
MKFYLSINIDAASRIKRRELTLKNRRKRWGGPAWGLVLTPLASATRGPQPTVKR